jgi:hypothetical protein
MGRPHTAAALGVSSICEIFSGCLGPRNPGPRDRCGHLRLETGPEIANLLEGPAVAGLPPMPRNFLIQNLEGLLCCYSNNTKA